MKILVIHGPNLNLLGTREPEKYGLYDSDGIIANLRNMFHEDEISYFQSNTEGEIVNIIQEANNNSDGILINAGGFSHTSVAIADAIQSIDIPCFAVHITNIYQREPFRHVDIIGNACQGTITGLGVEGYTLAMECLTDKIKEGL